MKSAETSESVLQVHPSSEEELVLSIIGPLDSKMTGLTIFGGNGAKRVIW